MGQPQDQADTGATMGVDAGALAGVRVLDVTDQLGAYATRLLSDLGADVIRIEPPSGSMTRRQAPLLNERDGQPPLSGFDLFVNAGKRSVTLDLDAPSTTETMHELVRHTDVLVESPDLPMAWAGYSDALLREANPGLVHVQITQFGRDHVQERGRSDDLLTMAAGGLLHLGGYPDAEPVVAYGQQSQYAASIFAALAALSGLIGRDAHGQGCVIDVSAQECVAQALEDSAVTYALTGQVRQRQGERPREAGTGVYPCKDGYVSMVAGRLGTARAWTALVDWINEEGAPGAEELREPKWGDFSHRQSDAAIDRFGEIFTTFAQQYTKQELYDRAQRRLIALSPVSTIQDLFENAQLCAREFFQPLQVDGEPAARIPGPPYRLSRTGPRSPRMAPRQGQHTRQVLVGELGLSETEYAALVERGEA